MEENEIRSKMRELSHRIEELEQQRDELQSRLDAASRSGMSAVIDAYVRSRKDRAEWYRPDTRSPEARMAFIGGGTGCRVCLSPHGSAGLAVEAELTVNSASVASSPEVAIRNVADGLRRAADALEEKGEWTPPNLSEIDEIAKNMEEME